MCRELVCRCSVEIWYFCVDVSSLSPRGSLFSASYGLYMDHPDNLVGRDWDHLLYSATFDIYILVIICSVFDSTFVVAMLLSVLSCLSLRVDLFSFVSLVSFVSFVGLSSVDH